MTDPARELDDLLAGLRPQLHRYCARMVGSAVDGEDVHNSALDFLRRRQRLPEVHDEEARNMIAAPDPPDPDTASFSLATFLRLPTLQRSALILKDVFGHSLIEVSSITGVSEPAAKAALQRGRVRLRELAAQPEDAKPPTLSDDMRARLVAYVDGFRTGDFDAVRAMLADDVRLDLVAKLTRKGKSAVSEYYERYEASDRWTYAAGVADGRPAMLVYDREISLEVPAHFVALGFVNNMVCSIHDFLFAGYALEGVEISRLPN